MDDFNINPDLIEKNHKKTKAIVVVHWAGEYVKWKNKKNCKKI